MKKVISTEAVPIKMWTNDIEDTALEQAKNLANLPFVFKHVAIMPDVHAGYGMPIGGVLATKGVVIPNAVGVDIGCGMCAMKTSLVSITRSDLQKIVDLIKLYIPVGFDHQIFPQHEDLMPDRQPFPTESVVESQYESALYQLGTLGGGNHFIEIQHGDDGHIWIMIHSGSRNLGLKVANHYNKVAISLNDKWHSKVNLKHELAFLPMDTIEAHNYMNEMMYCVDFALANRKLMMSKIEHCFDEVFPGITFIAFDEQDMINIAHNYAKWEHHFGHNVMVHRKGATSAKQGEIGIIPGSQGTSSYIVMGLGSENSYMSCSHGAGRTMGRKEAIRTLNLDEEITYMNNQGIIHSISSKEDLDESPNAYKNINEVIANQLDLIKVLVKLQPLAVIKG